VNWISFTVFIGQIQISAIVKKGLDDSLARECCLTNLALHHVAFLAGELNRRVSGLV
jgi:hypothetical protein